jgi:hypothetical protein
VEPPLEQPGELLAFGFTVQHRFEGLAPDVGVDNARVGELFPMSTGIPCSPSNVSRHDAAPAPPVIRSVPSISNRIAIRSGYDRSP